jgi:hypothetical protein
MESLKFLVANTASWLAPTVQEIAVQPSRRWPGHLGPGRFGAIEGWSLWPGFTVSGPLGKLGGRCKKP